MHQTEDEAEGGRLLGNVRSWFGPKTTAAKSLGGIGGTAGKAGSAAQVIALSRVFYPCVPWCLLDLSSAYALQHDSKILFIQPKD